MQSDEGYKHLDHSRDQLSERKARTCDMLELCKISELLCSLYLAFFWTSEADGEAPWVEIQETTLEGNSRERGCCPREAQGASRGPRLSLWMEGHFGMN